MCLSVSLEVAAAGIGHIPVRPRRTGVGVYVFAERIGNLFAEIKEMLHYFNACCVWTYTHTSILS